MKDKASLWDDWVGQTLLADVRSAGTPDPVPVIDEDGAELETTEAFDSYRYGRGDGQYLYFLYQTNEPIEKPRDIIPVYIGETNSITGRLYDHFKRLRDSLPVAEWDDDGSWGSWSKYDHIAGVYEHGVGELYAWILDVETLEAGPYGYATYRQELEAKLVGLVHSLAQFEQVFANREFVPNRVVHEMGKVGPAWLTSPPDSYDAANLSGVANSAVSAETKTDLWHEWVKGTIVDDIRNSSENDPIPLFETDAGQRVSVTGNGVLKRSDAIDGRIRREGRRCVHADGVYDEGPDGLLYVMYQLSREHDRVHPTDIVPRYIGKAEAYGKKNELSANFTEIATGRQGTRSFARWGDGDYWHIGTLSNTIFGRGEKKLSWASELFEQGTRRLIDDVYLWVRAWDHSTYPCPYEYDAYLAEVEPLLIALAYETYPKQLLNHEGVPDSAPIKQEVFEFQPVE